MESKIKHLMYVPFTGLGNYDGFRGNTWLKNRIEIFKQFVVPSLKVQTNQNFIIWISWRREERNNPLVQKFLQDLKREFGSDTWTEIVFTFAGVCFYDDKYEDNEARSRLLDSLHGSMPELFNVLEECDYVLMTIQPSDDLYYNGAVANIQETFYKLPELNAVGFKQGYICNYTTKEVAEYNPTTNPPFYTIKFLKETFVNPLAHAQFTALKKDVGKYKKDTPLPSHEYVGDCLRYGIISDKRGFLVGTHGVNISTAFNNPYKGAPVEKEVLMDFGIYDVPAIKVKVSLGKKIMVKLPHKVQRKLRYWFSEKLRI